MTLTWEQDRFIWAQLVLLAETPHKGPVAGRGCLGSLARTDPLWVQRFQNSWRRLSEGSMPSARLPLLSACHLDSGRASLWLDGRKSEGPQGAPKEAARTAFPTATGGGGVAHLSYVQGMRPSLLCRTCNFCCHEREKSSTERTRSK